MARTTHSYDDECERLARHFLADERHTTDAAVRDLAQAIQNCVEDWLSVTDLILYTRTPNSDGEGGAIPLARSAPAIDPRDPDPTREGMFRDHNCYRCKDGSKPCVRGNPRQCEFPHARND